MSDPRPIVINPVAGGGRGRRAQAAIFESLGSRARRDSEFTFTERPGHAVELAQDGAAAGFDPVVAVGGDGTVHEVANGLLRFTGAIPRLAVVPIGTGNDFARSVGIPSDTQSAVAVASGAPWDGATRVSAGGDGRTARHPSRDASPGGSTRRSPSEEARTAVAVHAGCDR